MSQRGLYNALNRLSVKDFHSLLLSTFHGVKPILFFDKPILAFQYTL